MNVARFTLMRFSVFRSSSAILHIKAILSQSRTENHEYAMSFAIHIRHFLAFFTFFGLWSLWQNAKQKLLLRIFSAVLIVFLFIVFSLTVLIDRFPEFNALSNIVSNVLLVLLFVTHLVIMLESISKHEAQAKLIENFSEVDRLFYAKIGKAIPYRSEKCEIFIRLLILTLIEIIVKYVVYIVLWFSKSDARFVFFTIYSNFVICLRLIQVIFFMYLLRNRLKWLNDELMDIFNSTSYHSYIQQITNKTKSEPIPFLRNSFPKRSMYNRLISLKQIYGHLFEICEQIAETFGWSLLSLVIFIFATVTFEFYWAYISLNEAYIALICLVYSVPISIMLGTLAFYCSSCHQQVHLLFICKDCANLNILFASYQSGHIQRWLHRIPIDEMQQPECDLIREFSLQVTHEHLCLSVRGFFELNCELLASVRAKKNVDYEDAKNFFNLFQLHTDHGNLSSIPSHFDTIQGN